MPGRGIPRSPKAVDLGDKTWEDVRDKLERLALGKYPLVDQDILEDALQDAMLDLLSYWQSLDSSHTGDPEKNFNYAVDRGKHSFARAVLAYYAERTGMTGDSRVTDDLKPGETLRGWRPSSHEHIAASGLDTYVLDEWRQDEYASNPREAARTGGMAHIPGGPDELSGDLIENAREMLDAMSPEELEDFFTYFGDETAPELAEKLGVTDRTVRRHRAMRRLDLQHIAKRYGITA